MVLFAGTNFHLAVLLPTANSWPEGRALIGAIALAVDDANAQAGQPDPVRAVRGGNVTYSWREADCEPSAALAALTHIIDEGPVDAVIGPDCSVACESTAGRAWCIGRHQSSPSLARADCELVARGESVDRRDCLGSRCCERPGWSTWLCKDGSRGQNYLQLERGRL